MRFHVGGDRGRGWAAGRLETSELEGLKVPLTMKELLAADAIDFDVLRHKIILAPAYAPSWGRKQSFDDQLDMVLREFVGQSEIKFAHAALIVALRRGIEVTHNFSRFMSLWEEHSDFLTETLDSRWLVSACDTLAQFSQDIAQAQLAAMGSLFVNTLKLYETERIAAACDAADPARIASGTPLFDGMTAFMIGGGDMVANLIGRLDATIASDLPAGVIVRELINRALDNETVFSRMSGYPQRHPWPRYLTGRPGIPARKQKSHGRSRDVEAGPGYILLNDTARLGDGFHLGPGFACGAIRAGLHARGVREWGWANSREGFERLLSELPCSPALVVLNGEGTLHHGAARAGELLATCVHAKKLGISVALVNTVWEDNPPKFDQALRSADLVHVRESASHVALPAGIAGSVTPDASILPLVRLYRDGAFPRPSTRLAVMDNVVAETSAALLEFSIQADAPFFVMPGRALGSARQRATMTGHGTRRPMLLQAPDVVSSHAWVTGRYHGLIAALCAGRPVCALPSNTHKIEGLLADAGLGEACLLPAAWQGASAQKRTSMVDERLELQREGRVVRARQEYLAYAVAAIERMLDEVSSLALSG